jgi:S-adenosylmethionine:tRNA ribosyltransferase-isomerase
MTAARATARTATPLEPQPFVLPPELEAREPPEARGLTRDGVRLMVASRDSGAIEHARFHDLPHYLTAGDLLVINVSATVPAACSATMEDGRQVRVHFSTRAPGLGANWRVVELRTPDGGRPQRPTAGERLTLTKSAAALELVAPYAASPRLMLAHYEGPDTLDEYLQKTGEPIAYGHLDQRWPLSAYQNVYATTPGSAEMPSAGRPFTERLITELVARGIVVAPIVLHCGVSSPERHEPPFPEPYAVPPSTARLINATRANRSRTIAVGTTVVRALETAADHKTGRIHPADGWTNLVITSDQELKAVDGLITGWHEPQASHLQMLEAVAGPDLLDDSYAQALEHGYLWHEFGDSHLILTRG